jgi:cysteine synthase
MISITTVKEHLYCQNIQTLAELIGKTPLLELSGLTRKYGLQATILAKLEYFNCWKLKDRIAKAMIEDARTGAADS